LTTLRPEFGKATYLEGGRVDVNRSRVCIWKRSPGIQRWGPRSPLKKKQSSHIREYSCERKKKKGGGKKDIKGVFHEVNEEKGKSPTPPGRKNRGGAFLIL